jgi:hypothetical protein
MTVKIRDYVAADGPAVSEQLAKPRQPATRKRYDPPCDRDTEAFLNFVALVAGSVAGVPVWTTSPPRLSSSWTLRS